jgi:arylformamidase
MSFDDLPPLPPLRLPGATEYAGRISAASRHVMVESRCLLDIPYRTDDYWQKLDIYLPAPEGLSGLPVFCFLHGGAWVNGCKEWMGFMAPPVTSLPAIYVSASYRHAPEARFPAQLDDCCDMLLWIRGNIARYGGDPDNVHFGGHSAGGHLAALTTLRRDALARCGLPPNTIKGCYPVSGVFDLADPGATPEFRSLVLDRFLGEPSQAPAASPIQHVEGNTTPFLVSWGTDDAPGLANQSRAFVAALGGRSAVLEAMEFPGYDHWRTSECAGDIEHRWTQQMRRWLTRLPGQSR